MHIMREYHKELDIIDDYEGQEWQVCSVSLVDEPHSVGEDQILYGLMNRHGDLKEVLDWELADYNAKKQQQQQYEDKTTTGIYGHLKRGISYSIQRSFGSLS